MITQTYNLNLIPEYATVPLIIKVSQYDNNSRTFVFSLWNGDVSFTPPSGVSAYIEGTKPDSHGFSYPATISGSTVRVNCQRQMAAVPGETRCEIKLVNNSTGEVLGTTNFVLYVEAAGLNDDTDISDTELPDLITLATDQMNQAKQAAQQAATSASSASRSATNANNSKNSAAASATNAANSETKAANSAEQAKQSYESTKEHESRAASYNQAAQGAASRANEYAEDAEKAADRAISTTPEGYGDIADAVINSALAQFFVKDGALYQKITIED